VIPYSEKIHQRGMVLATPLPVLSIRVVDPAATGSGAAATGAATGSGAAAIAPANYCAVLAAMKFTAIDLTVNVTGLKDVTVLNETGPQDTSKPFALFGQQPAIGAAAIIGSNELCYKNTDGADIFDKAGNVTINILWTRRAR